MKCSDAEISLLMKLRQVMPDVISQLCLSKGKQRYYYDYARGRKLIEFNGDYWHANPDIYQFDDYVGEIQGNMKQAWELWAYDEKKKKLAESMGYDVLTVWESDWIIEPRTTLEKCIEFLK